ncbi:LysR family transcriptional regulator [Bradyrhizobium vignae]|uniref:Regulatory protein, LysR:LysR, substrate-binding n=1 Tax=Bradyrhizobium vignae TaxID=1549949 RepID=A0A2U3PUR4_9BRAD|nr:LysR family transcriptional regulator [Bradyrhizobium vignae]SPP92892.1 Regulatory protein, LysR:LysR, substrate-binding [Bradyrhizobium vignae]
MEIKQLSYFMWVFEEGSFSKAAIKARTVQPALSMQIRRLEEEFGVQLFERHPRGIKATAAGNKLYKRCVAIMQNISLAEEELRVENPKGAVTGKIHVGLSGMFNRSLLKNVLLPFLERHPHVDVVVSESYTGTLVEWVRDGLVDFALGSRPEVEGHLVQRLLYRDRVVLMSGSPLFGASLTPCDLTRAEGLKLILPTTKHSFGRAAQEYIERGLINAEKVIEINSTAGSISIAMNSDWAVMGAFIGMVDDLDNPKVFVYPVVEPALSFDLYALFDHRRPLSAAARQFVHMIELEFKQVDALWDQLQSAPQ